jgi:hypothetical protein
MMTSRSRAGRGKQKAASATNTNRPVSKTLYQSILDRRIIPNVTRNSYPDVD